MNEYLDRAVAIVGMGAIMPDAPNAQTFWQNIKDGRYSISEVDPSRWDPELYYDPDPKAPDKTYSRIGGWVREWDWDPFAWKLALMPRVADAMDDTQKWAVACTQQALNDYGYPARPLETDRVAVVLGNAMGGERHYQTTLRINFAEIAEELGEAASFHGLPNDVQRALLAEFGGIFAKRYPEITEDSMPGELSNCVAGRVANLFGFRGPNYVIDAACASALAATSSAVHGLLRGDYDAAITGGIDRNMGASTFVKFCKIGALSATGTRPYAAGSDGFVMGEGGAVFLLKRLRDAVDAGDHIDAVILGVAGSSDGRGKGITAPNPVGQKLALERAWNHAGVAPQTASLVEGHGTSTAVGDVVEHDSMASVFSGSGSGVGLDRPRFGEVKYRPPEGGGRGCGHVQGRDVAPRQAAPTQPQLLSTESEYRLLPQPVPGQHRAARVGPARGRGPPGRRQRFRLRRDQLSHGARGVHARAR